MNHTAEFIAQDLDLDLPGPRQQLLEVHTAITERGARCVLRHLELRLEGRLITGYAHTFAAATCRGLDDNREANLMRDLQGRLNISHSAVAARHRRHVNTLH